MKLQPTFAAEVYDILVTWAGAYDNKDSWERNNFIYDHTKTKYDVTEWRFCGKLGFGGKYWSDENCVTCYSEDETKERLEIIKITNEKLAELAKKYKNNGKKSNNFYD